VKYLVRVAFFEPAMESTTSSVSSLSLLSLASSSSSIFYESTSNQWNNKGEEAFSSYFLVSAI
jgi:hypothetical protein